MCGRYYTYSRTSYEVENELGLEPGSVTISEGDITPGMSPVVLSAVRSGADSEIKNVEDSANNNAEDKKITISNMFWGLSFKDKKLIINARCESVFSKKMFTDGIERRRIVIPAAGFYEWDRDKNKVSFYKKDKKPIYLAGFYELSDNKDSFVILTTSANESMIRVHDRMPLMIDQSAVKDWLYDTDSAREMLSMEMPLLESHQDYEQLSLF